MTERYPIVRIINSVLIYDEIENIKCPLYRERRSQDIITVSMSHHRSYARKLLSYYTEIDEVQEWILHLVGLLYRRLDNSSSGLRENKQIRQSALPECLDTELRHYRETVLKLLS